MENRQIKELMAVMQRTGTKRLAIKKEGFELELERDNREYRNAEPPIDLVEDNPMREEFSLQRASQMLSKGSESLTQPLLPSPPPAAEVSSGGGLFITSPLVGTFYSSPGPEAPPFLKMGDRVEKDTVVCIVEAMKVMNEIKAGVAGTVTEALVQNGDPVEFSTKLFRVV